MLITWSKTIHSNENIWLHDGEKEKVYVVQNVGVIIDENLRFYIHTLRFYILWSSSKNCV